MYIDTRPRFKVYNSMSHPLPPPIRVQVGPSNAFSHHSAFQRLSEFFSADELSQALWIGGRRASAAAGPWLPPAFHEPGARRVEFQGHCCESLVAELASRVGSGPVIGLGGGSALDTAKAVAIRTHRPFVALPTIAATCAAWTPLSVWYDDQGRALQFEVFPQGAFLTLIEPALLASAPVEYLAAGIGDTLAKWYEAAVLVQGVDPLPLTARLGLDMSRTIRDVLLDQGSAAIEANRRGVPDPAFVNVVDAIVAAGGAVGGLGERFTRVAAAHSVHNGLTLLPETATVLHGAKVAFGILVQLALQGEWAERDRLRQAYGPLGLPTKLADLGIDPHDPRLDAVVAKILLPHESIHALPFPVTATTLQEALRA